MRGQFSMVSGRVSKNRKQIHDIIFTVAMRNSRNAQIGLLHLQEGCSTLK